MAMTNGGGELSSGHVEDIANALEIIADAMPDLRDRFAAAALTGYLAAFTGSRPFPGPVAVAIECYAYADAMLAERRKEAEGV
jgi:phosphoenolpyruvate carboxylase